MGHWRPRNAAPYKLYRMAHGHGVSSGWHCELAERGTGVRLRQQVDGALASAQCGACGTNLPTRGREVCSHDAKGKAGMLLPEVAGALTSAPHSAALQGRPDDCSCNAVVTRERCAGAVTKQSGHICHRLVQRRWHRMFLCR